MADLNSAGAESLDEASQIVVLFYEQTFSDLTELFSDRQRMLLCQHLAGVFHRLQQSIAEDME